MTSARREFQTGEMIPGTVYSVVRQIGAGGMGTVYDVEDTTIGKRYVLKTLHAQLGDRADLARRMQNEARALARLHHPNIVEVITAGMTADDLRLPYYVMERLTGQSIRYVLQKKGQLDAAHAIKISIDLLDALDHAHEAGVVHRDVKPDNIFLHRTPTGVTVTKLLDFGIMSVLDGGIGETRGRFLGTLRYAAPEQLRGEKATPKVDLYATALVLYEMLAGRGPFDDEPDQQRIAAAHLHRVPPPLSQFALVPAGVTSLVEAALAKDPAARPRDAFTFASSLRSLKRVEGAIAAGEATEQRPTVQDVLGHAPQSQGSMPSAPSTPAPRVPATTIVGMMQVTVSGPTLENAPPTVGPTLASAGASPVASPPGVDRSAPTNTFTPPGAQGPARSGTDPLGATVPSQGVGPDTFAQKPVVVASPADPVPAAFHWPAQVADSKSDSAHSRTLGDSAAHGRKAGGALAAGIAGALVCVAAVAAVVGWRVTHKATPTTTAAPPPIADAPIESASAPLPPPAVVTIAAPTIAPPGLDDPGASSITAPSPAASPALPTVHKPGPLPRSVPTRVVPSPPAPAPAPVPAPKPPDRPGAGF